MKRSVKYCLLIALCICGNSEHAICGWNIVGQFQDEVAGCGFFWNASSGLVGFGSNRGGGTMARIRKTTDGGKTWAVPAVPNAIGGVTSIFMKDQSIGYASISETVNNLNYSIWKTTDGGNTWFDDSPGNGAITNCVYATSKSLIRTVWYNFQLGGVSIDDGVNFSEIFSTGNASRSNGIDFSDDLTGVVTMGPPDFGRQSPAWYTQDGGLTWNQGDYIPESWSVYGVKGTKTFLTMSEDFQGNPGQTVFSSQNGGMNWAVRFAFPNTPSFTGHITGAGSTVYVQTDLITNQGLFRSDDLGQNWINVGGPSNNRDTRFTVTGCRGEVVYAFDDQGNIWKTTDGGDGAFGLTPRVGKIASGKAGDTVLIPIYLDSVAAPFTISRFTGNLAMNTDLLSPFGFDTTGTLSQSVSFDTVYSTPDKSINFLITYTSPLKNGIALSMPIIYIKATAYLTKTDTTSVTLNSLNINTGPTQQSLSACSSSSNLFTLANECGDSSIRQFMISGNVPKLFAVHPNPNLGGEVEASISLPQDIAVTLELADAMGKVVRSDCDNMPFQKGEHTLHINTTQLANGSYLLRMRTSDGHISQEGIVILH